MNATTNTVIVDPVPSDYLAIGGDAEEADVQLHLFTTGQAEVRSAPQSRRAVWLINTRLPDMSGQDLYTTLRRQLEGLPVFFVSDQYSLDDERAVMSLGGVNYVCKPLEMLSFRELAETAKSLALMG